MSGQQGARSTYRHGDLREALVDAGVELARAGGPAAVVLREVTRRAGVAPNAAYRHFSDRDDLLSAVSARCLQRVAHEMGEEIRAATPQAGPVSAEAELDAVGRAYVHFALREPGLFTAAFTVHRDTSVGAATLGGAPGPFAMLSAALDHAVHAGLLAPGRRQGAEALAWSAVHGLAVLLLEGPLRSAGEQQREWMLEHVLAMVRGGLFDA
jgi:AcrR family transcriptional regulator